MKACLIALLASLALSAAVATPVVLPQSEWADMESITNVPVVVNVGRLKACTASISFESNQTNEVLIALGRDANADGDLAFDETDLLFGCDCGSWYSADLRTGETIAANTNALTIGRSAFSPLWNRAKLIRRGGGESVATFSLDVENTRFDIMIR